MYVDVHICIFVGYHDGLSPHGLNLLYLFLCCLRKGRKLGVSMTANQLLRLAQGQEQ